MLNGHWLDTVGQTKMENSYSPYSHLNGVPQESKLATYMNRQNSTTPVNALAESLGGLVVDQDALLIGAHRRDLSTPTSLIGLGRNGESPGLSAHAPSPIRESPVSSVSILSDSAYQTDSSSHIHYPMAYVKPSFISTDKMNYMANTGRRILHSPTVIDETVSNSKNIRSDILEKNALLLAQPDPESYAGLPAEVGQYTDLVPLEPLLSVEQLPLMEASTYKATHSKTGVPYCLRRIHSFRISSTKNLGIIEMWKKLTHVNIVQLREVFTTRDFGDNSMVLVYDYHPGSATLWAKHFDSPEGNTPAPFSADPNAPVPYSHSKNTLLRHQHSAMMPENLLWNYIIQLTAALRAIHSLGLACRTIEPSKVIITSRNRLRLSFTGVADVLTPEVYNIQTLIPHHQQEDLTSLGKLVLVLACRSVVALENVPTALDLVGRTYSLDLKNLISYLLNTSTSRRTVTDLMPMIGARFYVQLENLQTQADELEIELSKELDNSRLVRLLTKLGTINDRPEFSMDSTWSETGDRYMLKLFRDYLFHQVTEDGRPWLDMSHIVHCLNKLETGSPERICLMSRDEQSILVVSYQELKHCLEQSFGDLLAAATNKSDIL